MYQLLFLLWISELAGNRITTLTITHNTTNIFLKNMGGPEKGRWFVDLIKSRLLFLQQFFASLCQFVIGVHVILCTIFKCYMSCLWIYVALVKNMMRWWYNSLLYFLAIRSKIASSLVSPWKTWYCPSSWSGGTCIDLIVHEHLSFNFVRSTLKHGVVTTDGAWSYIHYIYIYISEESRDKSVTNQILGNGPFR